MADDGWVPTEDDWDYFDIDTSDLPIEALVDRRVRLGLTVLKLDPIPEEYCDFELQAEHCPPEGWREIFKDKLPLAFIKQNMLQFGPQYYPHPPRIFDAFRYTPLKGVKVVLVGQDPYPQKDKATGLAFSVPEGHAIDNSVRNIFKEIKNCYPDFTPYKGGDLTHWAQQGVLMLNMCLTLVPGIPASHGRIWMPAMNVIIKEILESNSKVVFILWGNDARKHIGGLVGGRAYRLESAHPSPQVTYSRTPFLGSGHFRLANEHLVKHGMDPIRW